MPRRVPDDALSRLRRMAMSSEVGPEIRAILDERERTHGALEAARKYASSVALYVFTPGKADDLQEAANKLIDKIDAAVWEDELPDVAEHVKAEHPDVALAEDPE